MLIWPCQIPSDSVGALMDGFDATTARARPTDGFLLLPTGWMGAEAFAILFVPRLKIAETGMESALTQALEITTCLVFSETMKPFIWSPLFKYKTTVGVEAASLKAQIRNRTDQKSITRRRLRF